MPKKKLSTKSASKKAVKSPKVAKSTKSKTINYLAPLHEVTQCIENDYSQLKKLLESTPAKLEKAIANVKTKLEKAKKTQTKAEKLLTEAKNKQKAKPAAQNKQALAKGEKALAEIKATMTILDAELKQLTEQLQTCKRMGNEYSVMEKSVKKVRADFEKQATKKPKQAAAKSKLKIKSNKKIQAEKASTVMQKSPEKNRETKLTPSEIPVAGSSLLEE